MKTIFVPAGSLIKVIPADGNGGSGCLGLAGALFILAVVVDSFHRPGGGTANSWEFVNQRSICAPSIEAWDQMRSQPSDEETLSRTGSYSLPQGLKVWVNPQPPANPKKRRKRELSSVTFLDHHSESHTCWVGVTQLSTNQPSLDRSGIIAPSPPRRKSRLTENHVGPAAQSNQDGTSEPESRASNAPAQPSLAEIGDQVEAAIRDGDYDRALVAAERAVRLYPDRDEALSLLERVRRIRSILK
jgi:hypothetical protein